MADTVKPITGRHVLVATVLFFGVIIGVNVVLTSLAISTMPGTEVDSAYRAGQKYNQEIAASRLQASRDWKVSAQVQRAVDGHAKLRIEARDHNGAPLGGYGFTARLDRPTTTRGDRVFPLIEPETGIYRGEVADVAAGQWDLLIEAERGGERLFLSRQRIQLN